MGILLLFCYTFIHPLLAPAVQALHIVEREEQWQQQQFLATDAPAELRVKHQKEQVNQWAVRCLGAVPPLTPRATVAIAETDALDSPPCRTGMLYTQTTASDL